MGEVNFQKPNSPKNFAVTENVIFEYDGDDLQGVESLHGFWLRFVRN